MAVESINLTWLDLPPKGESRKKKKKDTTGLWFFFFRIGFYSTTRTSDFPLRLYIPMPESAPHSALALYKPTKATLRLPIATAVTGLLHPSAALRPCEAEFPGSLSHTLSRCWHSGGE